MIDEKYLNSFVSKEKTELLRKIESETVNFEKVMLLRDYENNINNIIKEYERLIQFSRLLLKGMIEEDSDLKEALILKTVFDEGLFISWDKKVEKFSIDYSKSTIKLSDDQYLSVTIKFLKNMETKLKKRVNSYQVFIDDLKLKGWGEF